MFLEKPSYELHDVYRALDVLGSKCDLIQSEVYKNSHLSVKETIRYFTTTALTITLKSNKKTESLLHSPFFPETQTSRNP